MKMASIRIGEHYIATVDIRRTIVRVQEQHDRGMFTAVDIMTHRRVSVNCRFLLRRVSREHLHRELALIRSNPFRSS